MTLLSPHPKLLLLQLAAFIALGTGAAWFASGAIDHGGTAASLADEIDAITVDGASLPAIEDEASLQAKEIGRLLDNAGLAMAAEQYFSPPERNARDYYESVLALDPEHVQANVGLDRLAEFVLERATAALADEQVQTAVNQLAAAKSLRPGHRLVALVEQQLGAERSRLIDTAQVVARAGDYDAASNLLSRAEAIPVSAPDNLQDAWTELGTLRASAATEAAVAASVSERRESEAAAQAAELEAQAQSERERAFQARVAQLASTARTAIEEERLLSPEWENAKQLIAELDLLEADQVVIARLRSAYLNKLIDGASQRIDGGDFESAEGWINEAALADAQDARLVTLRDRLDAARFDAERQRIAALNEFKFANYVAPRYPSVARQRGAEGWVDVQFLVTEDGRTENIEILDSARTANFRDAAVSAIRQWRLEPRTYLGRPLAQRVRTRLAFRLGE